MNKYLLPLITAISLSACQSQPVINQTASLPAQTAASVQLQPHSQAPISQNNSSKTVQNSRPTPQIDLSAAKAPAKPAAPSLTKPAASVPASKPAETSSAANNTQAQVLISSNYNTETLVAGLHAGADLADAEAIAQRHQLSIERYISSIRTVVYKTQGQEVTNLLESLKKEASLEYVETDQVASQKPESEKAVTESFKLFSALEVNDKYFADQYSLSAMHVPQAWELSKGTDVVVAVIDTGVDMDHPDLKSRVLPGYDAYSQKEGPKAGDVSSLNYIMSSYKHGSHVAGIIAAETNNSKGIAGVAPEAKILPISIFPNVSEIIKSILAPSGDESQTIVSILADAIVWAADHDADVINMSLAVNEQSATIERAVKYALDKGVSVIVAAGNSRHIDNARNYLAAIDGVVGVGATDETNKITVFSNSGDYLSVAAPGFDVISSVPSFLGINPYVKMSGTSMAAPNVAGVAALLKSKYGATATPAWIKARLQESAHDEGEAGRDDLYGYGLVDAYKALGGE